MRKNIALVSNNAEIAKRELEAGYITYRTLSDRVGDMVLCNSMEGRYGNTMKIESGSFYPDNSDEIDELYDEIDELEDSKPEEPDEPDEDDFDTEGEYEAAYAQWNKDWDEWEAKCDEIDKQINEKEDRIYQLQIEERDPVDIFQWFIISDSGASYLNSFSSELVFYDSELDVYVWGITHWGTSWDYTFTDIVATDNIDDLFE